MRKHYEVINELTCEFLSQSNTHIVLCEGVGDGFYGTIKEVRNKYPMQCYELPCAENASVGMAMSSSTYGLTTILCFQRVNLRY